MHYKEHLAIREFEFVIIYMLIRHIISESRVYTEIPFELKNINCLE